MYNLSNLNWLEFEYLAKDIMQILLQCKFTRYKVGIDGGIDLKSHEDNIIVQCKHINNFQSLKTKLLDGKDQAYKMIESGDLNQYYVFTSLELNPMNRKEIYTMFSDFMSNGEKNIIDGLDINDFLDQKENIGILRKHYKLWLTSTNMLEIIQSRLNSNYICDLHNEIKKYGSMFVDTSKFHEAYRKLIKNRAVLITGGPGVGKSITSLMLISYLLNEDNDYEIIHIASNSVDKIIEYLDLTSGKKQILYMDDFLGRTYLNFDSNKIMPLNQLFKIVEHSANMKIIINSRITVLQDVKNSLNYDFNKSINDFFMAINVDLNNISMYEKASMLYNHLYYKNVPYDYYKNIQKDKHYLKIIYHPKYNPRIIDYVTDKNRYGSIVQDKYYDFIIKNLNDPFLIWKEEFSGYSSDDTIFCQLLYSLSEIYIASSSLEIVFNKYYLVNGITPKDSFEDILLRLSNSIINISIYENKRYISFSNPSLLDYFERILRQDSLCCINILKSINYCEQFERTLKFGNNSLELVGDIDLFSLKLHSTYKYGMKEESRKSAKLNKVINLICKFRYLSEKTRASINDFINRNRTICTVIELMGDKDTFDYYQINDMFENDYIEFLFCSDMKTEYADWIYDSLRIINDNYNYLSEKAKHNFVNLTKKYSIEILNLEQTKHVNIFDDVVDDIITNNINEISVSEYKHENRTYLELDNTEENSQALYSITKQIEKSILETSGNEIDFPNLNIFPRLVKVSEDTLDSTSYDDKVIKIIEKMNYDDYMGDNYKDYYSDLEAEDNDIDELFQYYNPKM